MADPTDTASSSPHPSGSGADTPGPEPHPSTSLVDLLAGRAPSARRVRLESAAPGGPVSQVVRPANESERLLEGRGTYQVVGQIGHDSESVVLKGHDVELGRDVALRVLRDEAARDAETLARFVAEAQLTGQLQHPGIAPVYEIGVAAGARPYVATKLLKGRSLAALLRERAVVGADAGRHFAVFESVCQTIAYAHARGVVHGGVAAANVSVGAFGEVHVVGWGRARVLPRPDRPAPAGSAAVAHASAGVAPEIAACVSPEVARGETDRIDERSDVFGLGALLVEILTGAPPYVGGPSEVMSRAVAADLADAKARLARCEASPDLVALARRCLEPEPRDRFRNAAEVADAAARVRASLEERARGAETATSDARAGAAGDRRARTVATALAGVATVALVAVAAAWSLSGRDDGPRGDLAGPAPSTRIEPPLQRSAAAAIDPAAAQREAAFVAGVEEAWVPDEDGVETPGFDERDAARRDRAYALHFAALGFDPESADAETAARAARATAVAPTFVAALDDWALARRRLGRSRSQWEPLLALADAADGDAARARLRRVLRLEAIDAPSVAAAMGSAGSKDAPAPTAALWIASLQLAGEVGSADAVRMDAVRRHPGDFRLVVLDAVEHERGGAQTREQAIRAYGTARALRPSSAGAAHRFGLVLERAGDPGDALAAFDEALRIEPDRAHVHWHRGTALAATERLDEAAAAFERAIALDPADAVAPRRLAALELGRGSLERARAIVEEALRRSPEEALLHTMRGRVLWEQGEREASLAAYERAVALAPTSTEAWEGLGDARRLAGDLAGAEAAHRTSVRLDPDRADGWTRLGVVLLRRGEVAGAIDAHHEGLVIDPRSFETHANLGDALAVAGRHREAVSQFREALGLKPTSERVRFGLALSLRETGDYLVSLRELLFCAELANARPDPRIDLEVREAERLLPYADRFESVFRGEDLLRSARDKFEIAVLAKRRGLLGAAAELFISAFEQDPSLGEDLAAGRRRRAASAALEAGCGIGYDQLPPGEGRRARWRAQALAWLRTDIAAVTEGAWRKDPARRAIARDLLGSMLQDHGLDLVRGEEALAFLPEFDRHDWRAFWADVEDLWRDAAP